MAGIYIFWIWMFIILYLYMSVQSAIFFVDIENVSGATLETTILTTSLTVRKKPVLPTTREPKGHRVCCRVLSRLTALVLFEAQKATLRPQL